MTRPGTGRRPDSLFDNRYRYDYIYPRGRSGETLRAYDTQDNDRPVVIKRPALQDAPPMRAGQEVSILNERRALERLSGHPVLTELRQVGTFRVSGQTHHYIVMDMAQGETVESLVLELAQRGETLPDLETLVIFDNLLDLLQTAHDRKIIYNDVDAKHLYWDRDTYRLKVIDWGNAILLDAENVPPHASRSADILQTGQLLYFVASGGRRVESGRPDPAADLGDSVPAALKAVINKAANPDVTQRYPEIAPLRHDLYEVRRPLERARDALVEHVRGQLAAVSSQDQLEELRATLIEALQSDPGYPPARALMADVDAKLRQLAIQGDLEAARIYMTSGNLGRAVTLLHEILNRAGDTEQPILNYLLDACDLFHAQIQLPLPAGFEAGLDALFQGDVQAAGRLLLMTNEQRPASRQQQFLLAERLTLHIPGLVLLRPHLARLTDQLSQIPGSDLQERTEKALQAIEAKLNEYVAPGIQPLLQTYESVSGALAEQQEALNASGIDSPYSAVVRALHAANRIVELLEEVKHNVLSDPTRAANALWEAAAIDPVNPAFDALSSLLNTFHSALDELRQFTPAADGSDISRFLIGAKSRLQPYAADVTDPRFRSLVQGIDAATTAWTSLTDFIALGGRRPAMTACRQASEAIRPLNEAAARWLDETQHRIETAPQVEYLSPNALVGRALADGWDAWDHGRGGEAQSAGERALQLATTESEKRGARRLIEVGEVLSSWLANEGPANSQRADQTESRVIALFLPEEDAIRRTFAEQMPNTQVYLKAMSKGVVEPMREASSAAVRLLFFHYVLRGILALPQEEFDEANFWREAASRTLAQARLHPAYQALDTVITRRQLVLEAERALNNIRHTADLAAARQAVRAPLAASQLEAAEQAVRSVDDALRRWSDGEFRSARQLLDGAAERVGIAETAMGKDLPAFRTWLQDIAASAEVLQQSRRFIEQAALVPADDPDPKVAEALTKIVEITRRDLGETHTVLLRQWRDTYLAIRNIYLDDTLAKDEKLRLFDSYFVSPFLEKQPALPIYRHWQNLIRQLPDPVPAYVPPDLPEPAYVRDGDSEIVDLSPEDGGEPSGYPAGESGAGVGAREGAGAQRTGASPARHTPLMLIGIIVVLVIVAAAIGVLALQGQNVPQVPFTPGSGQTQGAIAATNTLELLTETYTPTSTEIPTSTPIPDTLTPTITQVVPTPTVPTLTPVPGKATQVPPTAAPTIPPTKPTLDPGVLPGSAVPTSNLFATPTPLPGIYSGDHDVLQALETLPIEKVPWNKDWFGPAGDGWLLGNSSLKAGTAPLIVRLGPDVLTTLFGADAARHLSRIDANLELVSYEKSLLPTGQVFFGIGLESIQGQRATVRGMLVQANVLDLGTDLNGSFKLKTQVPVTPPVKLTVSVQRNADGTLLLSVNGQPVGQSNAAYAPNTPVTIYMYTSGGGVVMNVHSLSIHLD